MQSPTRSVRFGRFLGLTLLMAVGTLALPSLSSAQIHRTIESPGPSELMKSERQRKRANELALRYLGTPLRGSSLRNLETLQRLLNGQFISKEDVMDQQSLGVVLGDVMAQNLHLTWVVVDDKVGHSRALRWQDTQPIFFPVTMISKRVSAGEKVDIQDLYQAVSDQVETLEASYGPSRKARKKPERKP
ncbi:MAG: DUF3806 domain-containing protein [Myxococcota bacterium]|nr:DUF3806 domain-containing protein [Myxococcota bacterium]